MPLQRVVAELPEAVSELCFVRFGLIARRLSGFRPMRWLARDVEKAAKQPIAGLLHSERFARGWNHVIFLQYWTGFDALDAWSHAEPHALWWKNAVERMRSKGDLGVYHEAFTVPRANIESIYLDCNAIGLSSFGTLTEPVGPRTTARDRLGRRRS